ncbi:MAG: hypothetical protein AABZ60_12085, partial [Planctomycetota bacterium]
MKQSERQYFWLQFCLLGMASFSVIVLGLQWGKVTLKYEGRYAAEEGRDSTYWIALTIATGSLRDWDEAWYAQIS